MVDTEHRFDTLDQKSGSMVVLNVKVVAIRGAVGDWAAYMGPAEWTDMKVALDGVKVKEESARYDFFPNISGPYRR